MWHFSNLDVWLGPATFYLLGALAVICGGLMLRARHPLQAAVSLIGVMLCLSGIYVMLQSPFLGVVQVLVYAGAIMMLVVFVIMVLNRAHDHEVPRFDRSSALGAVVIIAVLGAVGRAIFAAQPAITNDSGAVRAQIGEVASGLFDLSATGGGYYVLFELIGVLLLVAVVGAVLLAKRHLDTQAVVTDVGHEAKGHHDH